MLETLRWGGAILNGRSALEFAVNRPVIPPGQMTPTSCCARGRLPTSIPPVAAERSGVRMEMVLAGVVGKDRALV
jgi:hypothetical protein